MIIYKCTLVKTKQKVKRNVALASSQTDMPIYKIALSKICHYSCQKLDIVFIKMHLPRC